MNLDAEDLTAIAETVTSSLNKVPRELKDVLQHGSTWIQPLLVTTPANYASVKYTATAEGLWLSFEVNNHRLFERFYPYSDEYQYPAMRYRT